MVETVSEFFCIPTFGICLGVTVSQVIDATDVMTRVQVLRDKVWRAVWHRRSEVGTRGADEKFKFYRAYDAEEPRPRDLVMEREKRLTVSCLLRLG